MSRAIKTFVLWLITLAIPAQGVAGLAMSVCPPAHHTGAAVSAVFVVAEHHGGSHAAEAADHQNHHAHHQAVAEQAVPDEAQTSGGESAMPAHNILNCCSASGAMAALTVPSLVPHSPGRLAEPAHPSAQPDLGITLGGLERPPKDILA